MFGFLKKKLKEAVEKISGVAETDIGVEEIEEAERKIEAADEIREDVIKKRELIIESGFELTQEVEKIIEKSEEQAHREIEPIEPEEKRPEETIKEIEEAKEEVIIQELQKEEIEEKIQEKITVEEIIVPKEEKKKGLLERIGMKKPRQEKALPAGFAVENEKKEEKRKETIFRKIKKTIMEKSLEESDIKDILWELQIGLVENDVAFGAAEKITTDLKNALLGRSIPKKDIESAVKESMKKSVMEILDAGKSDIEEKIKSKKPFLIVFLGFNGVGKTTTIARVGHLLKKKGFECVFAAADTWRAGAIQQIEEHGSRLGIKVIRQDYGSDPAAIIFDAKKYAESHGVDVILADTAGRSHTNVNLVDELKKICRVNKPDLKILVIDALTGNDVVEQARYFDEAVGADGLIITKADVYEKGGSILSAVHTIKKPIFYLGVGQGYDNLQKFDAVKIAEGLLE